MKTTSFLLALAASTALAAPVTVSKRQNRNGRCGTSRIIFRNGLDGRVQAAFQPANQGDFAHGSALNIRIIADFICGRLQSACGAAPEVVASCQQAAQTASGLEGQAAADAFNNGIGEGNGGNEEVSTAIVDQNGAVNNGQDQQQQQQDQNQNQNQNNNQNNNQDQNQNNNNNNNNNDNAGNNDNGAIDFGICSNPTMVFREGNPGRPAGEFTFIPADSVNFGGQSPALNPAIIANFICDTFVNRCGANQAALDACARAEAAVQAIGTRDQSAADAFNAALGF